MYGAQQRICRTAVGRLGALATDAAGELDVLRHDGDALGVDGAQVGVLEEADKVRFGSLLKCKDSSALPTQIIFYFLRNLTDQALERSLANHEIGGLLTLPDLSQL